MLTRRRTSRWWIRLMVLLLGVGLLGAWHVSGARTESAARAGVLVAPAAAVEPVAWTHNISGNTQFAGDPAAVNWLIWHTQISVNNGGLPVAVGIQESCSRQREALLNHLKTNVHSTYTMMAWIARPDVCGGYGNAIYVIAGVAGFAGPFNAQNRPDDGDTRGYACMRSALGVYACTAHLICPQSCGDEDQAAQVRVAQFGQYRAIIRELIASKGCPCTGAVTSISTRSK